MSRLAGRGDGSVIGGVIGLRVEPGLLSLLAAGRQVVLVDPDQWEDDHDPADHLGAECAGPGSGLQRVRREHGGRAGRRARGLGPEAPYAVLEVDEKYLPAMLRATSARVVTLLNLSRDQMDRAAEIWLVARRWREAFEAAPDGHVVANADDPLIVWAASGARKVTWVAARRSWPDQHWWCCPQCGSHLRRDDVSWHCAECGFARPRVTWALDGGNVIDPAGRVAELALALPGRANRSNAVVALAVAEVFGVSPAAALEKMRSVTSVAGRYTQVERHGRQVRLLLAKNPAGWLEAFDVLEPAPVPVLLAVNAQIPDGRDTSWLWDVDYRVVRDRPVLVSGERALDLAVRLEADGVAFRAGRGTLTTRSAGSGQEGSST